MCLRGFECLQQLFGISSAVGASLLYAQGLRTAFQVTRGCDIQRDVIGWKYERKIATEKKIA